VTVETATTVTVTIENRGQQPATGVGVTLMDDGIEIGATSVDVATGASATIDFPWTLATAGLHSLEASVALSGDGSAANDSVTATVNGAAPGNGTPQLQLRQVIAYTNQWTQVQLDFDYGDEMVVMCSPNYDLSRCRRPARRHARRSSMVRGHRVHFTTSLRPGCQAALRLERQLENLIPSSFDVSVSCKDHGAPTITSSVRLADGDGIADGLVGVVTTVEPCRTSCLRWREGSACIQSARRKCLILSDHVIPRDFGLIHVPRQSGFHFHCRSHVPRVGARDEAAACATARRSRFQALHPGGEGSPRSARRALREGAGPLPA
jgi:hypothetical protein